MVQVLDLWSGRFFAANVGRRPAMWHGLEARSTAHSFLAITQRLRCLVNIWKQSAVDRRRSEAIIRKCCSLAAPLGLFW
jgi:hypothetical protein